MIKSNAIIFSFVFALTLEALALNPQVQLLVDFETKGNAAGIRSNEPIAIEHYEIPLSYLYEDREFNLDEGIRKALVFDKKGVETVRWVINPEDTKWFKKVEEFMLKRGLKPVKHKYFTGYQTASRSYIVEDPVTKMQFSIKTSTDKTGGAWKDKKQPFSDGFDIRMISNLVERIQKRTPFKHLVVLAEPLTLGIKAVDQSIVVRELGALNKSGDFIYVPGFSVLHESAGREIAEKNGSSDPFLYWTENYIKPAARAAAEFSMKTGLWFDSPHSQNFLVELDKNLKPTGRIVLRDLGDVFLFAPVIKALGEEEILKKFSEKDNIVRIAQMGFGPLHGNSAPSWITQEGYGAWETIYNEQVLETVSEITKIPREVLNKSNSHGNSSYPFSYYSSNVVLDSPEMKSYLSQMTKAPKLCAKLHLK